MTVGKTSLLTVDCHKTNATAAKLEDKRDDDGGFGAEDVGQNQKAREVAAGECVLDSQLPWMLSSEDALGEWYFSMCVSRARALCLSRSLARRERPFFFNPHTHFDAHSQAHTSTYENTGMTLTYADVC